MFNIKFLKENEISQIQYDVKQDMYNESHLFSVVYSNRIFVISSRIGFAIIFLIDIKSEQEALNYILNLGIDEILDNHSFICNLDKELVFEIVKRYKKDSLKRKKMKNVIKISNMLKR